MLHSRVVLSPTYHVSNLTNAFPRITKDSNNPKLFTNRAMTRIRLHNYNASIDDCLHAISLDSNSMKAYYYLAQSQLALSHPNEAYTSAITAYDRALAQQDKSIKNVSELVLATKKAKWEFRERERQRGRCELLTELEGCLESNMRKEIALVERSQGEEVGKREVLEEIEQGWKRKREELRNTFAIANPKDLPRRVSVPSWISGGVKMKERELRGQNKVNELFADNHNRKSQTTLSTMLPSQSCTTP